MCNAAACTSNLHSLSCQLAVQAKDRRHTVHWLEDWVERALGRLSARTRGRVVRDPAHVAASIELDLRAIQTAAVLASVQLSDDDTLLGWLSGSQTSMQPLQPHQLQPAAWRWAIPCHSLMLWPRGRRRCGGRMFR
jgi:hypothetical protein